MRTPRSSTTVRSGEEVVFFLCCPWVWLEFDGGLRQRKEVAERMWQQLVPLRLGFAGPSGTMFTLCPKNYVCIDLMLLCRWPLQVVCPLIGTTGKERLSPTVGLSGWLLSSGRYLQLSDFLTAVQQYLTSFILGSSSNPGVPLLSWAAPP